MNEEQIMELVCEYGSAVAESAHECASHVDDEYRELAKAALQTAITELMQERDEFKTRMQRLMTTQLATNKERDALKAELAIVKMVAAAGRLYVDENKALRAELEDERTRGLQLLADAKEWQQQFVGAQAEVRELKAEVKTLRDALEKAEKVEPVGKWVGDCVEWTDNPYKFKLGQPIFLHPPTAPAQPIPYSGAEENPPVFARRWSLARDGFGVQRDDEGCYVHIDDALSVLHQSAPAQQHSPICEYCENERPVIHAPAQQPLSVLQIERIYDEVPEYQPDGSWWIVALARAIEQAHGIKGASL